MSKATLRVALKERNCKEEVCNNLPQGQKHGETQEKTIYIKMKENNTANACREINSLF